MRKVKDRKKKFGVIAVIAVITVTLAYYISTLPKTDPNLPQPSKFTCINDVDCPQKETCRREISLATKNFFGNYMCLNKVDLMGSCETWSNCESGKCSQGKCAK
jgi:hypothetical protein